jgi:hypothetical protein
VKRNGSLAWLVPLSFAIGGAILAAWCLGMPNSYHAHHEWPALAVLVGFVFFVCGLAKLFWCAIPLHKTGEALLAMGLILMVSCWLAWHSLAGVIAGGVFAMIGFGMIALRASLSRSGPR